MKKTRGQKSNATVPLSTVDSESHLEGLLHSGQFRDKKKTRAPPKSPPKWLITCFSQCHKLAELEMHWYFYAPVACRLI